MKAFCRPFEFFKGIMAVGPTLNRVYPRGAHFTAPLKGFTPPHWLANIGTHTNLRTSVVWTTLGNRRRPRDSLENQGQGKHHNNNCNTIPAQRENMPARTVYSQLTCSNSVGLPTPLRVALHFTNGFSSWVASPSAVSPLFAAKAATWLSGPCASPRSSEGRR